MTRRDRVAMKRCIAQMRAESAYAREHVDRVLAKEGFESAGETAAYHVQRIALGFNAFQCPPCWADRFPGEAFGNRKEEIELLRRLLAAGFSRYEPDPAKALAEIEPKSA
jgi:hypothetical protein